jgi:hypothetical protein
VTDGLLSELASGALDNDVDSNRVIDRCLSELEVAPRVLSVPGLINRLWLGAGPDGYEGPAAYEIMGALPRIAQLVSSNEGLREVERQPAVALGAIVEVSLGQSSPVYAEVVWKEGAHPALSADYLPSWLAGAPALPNTIDAPPSDFAPNSERVLRERLLLDFSCFGTDFAPPEARLNRLRGNARWLDPYGHLVLNVEYEPGEDEDDLAFWATWVCTHAERALAVADVEPDPIVLRRCAGQLLEALSSHPDVRAFGPYLMSDRHYQALIADSRDLYDRVARGLAHVHREDQRAWGSMSQRLDELIPEAMVGTSWASQVMAASLYTLELLAAEAPGGDWDGVHLRLDDAWQGGGLWRAEALEDVAPLALDPAIALGLGWAEHTGHFDELPREMAMPAWLAKVEDVGAEVDEWSILDSEVVWIAHVSSRDIDAGRLSVPSRIRPIIDAALITFGQDRLVTWIHHAGEAPVHTWGPVQPDGQLTVGWPTTVLVGTLFTAVWSLEGSPIVRAYSRHLSDPVEIGGVTYLHDFDEQMVLAYLGLIERPAQVVTLDRLVRAAVRHYGELAPNGQWCLSAEEICAKCFGPLGEVAPRYADVVLRRAVDAAVGRLVGSGRASRQGGLVLIDETTAVSNQVDRALLDRYIDGQTQRLRREASRSWVPPGVVNLPEGWRASPEKIATWSDVAGTEHLPDGELGHHQTWRKGHVRGSTLSPAIERDLERAARALSELGANPEQLADLLEAMHFTSPLHDPSQDETSNPVTFNGEI